MSRKLSIPAVAEPLVGAIRQAQVFTQPTLPRFIGLMSCLIVTMGRRTVSRALKVMGPLLEGHWSNYHRVYSQARIHMWDLAAVLVRQVVRLLPAGVPIVLLGDDTVDGKNGDQVWARSAHRDSVRSSRSRDNMKFGHKWLVLCVRVDLPGMARPWALPILSGLCLSEKVAKRLKRRPKTPAQLTRQLLMQLMRWMPQQKFILIGDYQVVTHQTAQFARRHADRVTVIGRLRNDANLYAAPAHPEHKSRCGGLVKKGRKLPAPSERITKLKPVTKQVCWYGNTSRSVRIVGETALWYNNHGSAVTPIRWVCVLGDKKLKRDDAYFYSSDSAMAPERIVELYASRWNIEVTFEETRALLGLETTRHWCRQSVLRVTPLIFGLFTAVALLWTNLPKAKRRNHGRSETPCYTKRTLTFADALFAVRAELWRETLLVRHRPRDRCLTTIPRRLRQTLLWHLAAAA